MAKARIQIGSPVPTLPESKNSANTGKAAPHWLRAANACKTNPGMWVPVTVPHLSVDRHRQVVGDIRKAKLLAFQDPDGGSFDAAYRERQLYIRYIPAGMTIINDTTTTKSA